MVAMVEMQWLLAQLSL